MDSQHRHELKTNELAEGLSHLPQLIKDNALPIIGVTLIIVALATAPMLSKMSRQKERAEQAKLSQSIQQLDGDIYGVLQSGAEDDEAYIEALNTLSNNANALLDNASATDNSELTAMALIKGAQAIRTELHLRKEVDDGILQTRIQKAKDAYQKAFDGAQTPTVRAMAQFGLGLCSEELGQTEQAAEIYQKIIENEAYTATVLPRQAQHRLDTLEDNNKGFHFSEVPVLIEELNPETTTPTIPAAPPETTEAPVVEESAEETPEPQAE